MSRTPQLLMMLLGMLAADGLDASTLDPWPAWRAFKQFARVVDEIPDPGVGVQITRGADSSTRLFFVRQVLELSGDSWLEPAGGVVCEFSFPGSELMREEIELWSFDHASFNEFVDCVEQHATVADLMVRQAEWSSVHWEDA